MVSSAKEGTEEFMKALGIEDSEFMKSLRVHLADNATGFIESLIGDMTEEEVARYDIMFAGAAGITAFAVDAANGLQELGPKLKFDSGVFGGPKGGSGNDGNNQQPTTEKTEASKTETSTTSSTSSCDPSATVVSKDSVSSRHPPEPSR